ncbi:MAG: hypothetical protein BGO69_07400 [Bacteroidetes bacterium 46-16]|nr:MAG: hypothetical protein BGO69_07400 [Bacteroidetes bacterium 46-16]
MKTNVFFTCLLAGTCSLNAVSAQEADTFATYSLSAYADVYYAAYTDSVGHGNFQQFPTTSPRNNSIGLNIVQVSSRYDGEKVRGMMTLHFGDIPKSTWSGTYNPIQEAHLGVRLCKTLWIDGGFFRTHFGTEYLLPVENITSSVAVATYFEPYYEAGLRLNYDPTDKLEINLFLLNGYGIDEDFNKRKSVGLGITYALSDAAGMGYTNYLGDDSPDTAKFAQTRFAQNLFFNYSGSMVKFQAGADLYIQGNSAIGNKNGTAMAYSLLATIGYQAAAKVSVYGRAALFRDPDGFLSGVITDDIHDLTGYKLWEGTAGLEVKPVDNSYVRFELRRLQMDGNQEIFRTGSHNVSYRYDFMVNAGTSFTLLKGVRVRN